MKSIENLLYFLNENLVTILIIIGLLIGIYNKIVSFMRKTDEEKIAIAKDEISKTMLKLITYSEMDFSTWSEAGKIKRSVVIDEIFTKYPILQKVADRNELEKWIDEQINTSLVTLRSVIKDNQKRVEQEAAAAQAAQIAQMEQMTKTTEQTKQE